MATDNSTPGSEPGIGRTLRDDLLNTDLRKSIRRDFKELEELMLDEDRQGKLRTMSQVNRWLHSAWWLTRSVFLRLTPSRRLLVVLGIIFLFIRPQGRDPGMNLDILGGLIFFFVLMLELKDKLIARNELQSGHAVQEALLPPRSPAVPGWDIWLYSRPANEVGGDLMDFMQTEETAFRVAVGDVAGKGLKAALLTAKLQATLRALVMDFHSFDALAARLNQIFCRDSLPNIFASLIFLEIRPDTGMVRLMNAGHFPPLLVSRTTVTRAERGGMALGLSPDATFTEQHLDLRQGDLILIYSDGLIEARNEEEKFYGDERLLALIRKSGSLAAAQIGEMLVADVDLFAGEAKKQDDLTIALLRRTGSP